MINSIKIIENYYNKGTAIYDLLLTHSTQVTEKALEICKKQKELNVNNELKHKELVVDNEFIQEAAMLHDIGIIKCHAPKIHCNGKHKYIEHGYLGAEILRREGLKKHALVCERHTGTGLSKETIIKQKFNIPHRDMFPESIEEQIICYADKFYSKSNPKKTHSKNEIIAELSRFGADNVATFEKWHKQFG